MRTPAASPERNEAPVLWRPSRDEATDLHRSLDALESALAFGARTRARLHLLEDRLVGMQTLAEDVGEAPGSMEDREVACAKIELLAQQFDVLAKKAVHESVPVLEGGSFRFSEVDLEIEIPNLRARGANSLGLFEHVEQMLARLGPGGCVLAGQAVPVASDEDPWVSDDGDEPPPSEGLPEGEYRVEVTYYAADASLVGLRLLGPDDRIWAEHHDLDLSADVDPEEVDLGVGLALVLERLGGSEEVELEHQTVQTLEWKHDTGERLESLEGWFHETVQPRDFELYALYLEQPLGTVRSVREEVEAFINRADAAVDALLEPLGLAEQISAEEFLPGADAWSLFDTSRLPTDPSPSAGGVARFYLSHLKATAGAPDLLLRSVEQALRELSDGDADAFARLLGRVRQALQFEMGHGPQAAWIARSLLSAAHYALGGDLEDARDEVLPLREASDAARPGMRRAA